MNPKGPFRLMTVNTAPERAKRVIGAMVENLKESYTIHYVVNSESKSSALFSFSSSFLNSMHLFQEERLINFGLGIEDIHSLVEEYHPDVLVSC
jgi:hypothetical protein